MRELGFNAPVGKLSAINAIVIIVLVPIGGALMQKFAAYRMVVIGGSICAQGVFITCNSHTLRRHRRKA
jgi:hypothetical protein